MNTEIQLLISKAKEAAQYAQAKYSGFHVGAALEAKNGRIFTGCNVESSSFGLTICAERVALTKALSEGETDFKRIIIFAKNAAFCPPCGACRQLLMDYAPQLEVVLTDGADYKTMPINDLLPMAFSGSQLK